MPMTKEPRHGIAATSRFDRMKKCFVILAVLVVAVRLEAQPAGPVRLALISKTEHAAKALDILTTRLSANQNIHLLERSEIEGIYREQGLSAANGNDFEIGAHPGR
jgi:hypothetical protein